MNKKEIIKRLRSIANILKPFTLLTTKNSKVWNGKEYAQKNSSESFDPFALAWWGSLITIASLLEAQECEISEKQKKYLHKELLGGMGSLIDFSLDERRFGEKAKIANENLKKEISLLYEDMKNLF